MFNTVSANRFKLLKKVNLKEVLIFKSFGKI